MNYNISKYINPSFDRFNRHFQSVSESNQKLKDEGTSSKDNQVNEYYHDLIADIISGECLISNDNWHFFDIFWDFFQCSLQFFTFLAAFQIAWNWKIWFINEYLKKKKAQKRNIRILNKDHVRQIKFSADGESEEGKGISSRKEGTNIFQFQRFWFPSLSGSNNTETKHSSVILLYRVSSRTID